MRLDQLPRLYFVDRSGAESELDLTREGGRLQAMAAMLSDRFAVGDAVGLIFRTEPSLVLWWLAAIKAGLRPLIMQYPTRKQSADFWEGSVRNTLEVASIKGVICGRDVAARLSGFPVTVFDEPVPPPAPTDFNIEFGPFSLIQLSSGTTGYRKALEFTSEKLARHVEDFNLTVRMQPDADMVVSWLPLYHDLGFIGCLTMPMLLGVRVTMIDPESWVADRSLLYAAIERRRGTICFMPNFAYEVMAGVAPGDLSSMRLWISGGEPIVPGTIRRFLHAAGQPDSSFMAAYGMAENILAISTSSGLRTHVVDGVEVTSCGRPIAGVEVKAVEDELWVRSPTAIGAYLGGVEITDAEGFYATGDLGQIVDGDVYVTGRKLDLLIQAGRKHMLSDIDAAANEALPKAKGRLAALAGEDDRLKTQKPVILIEAQDFFQRSDQAEVAGAISARTGLDSIEVAFVPPRFVTKSSSGKINRKLTLEHWRGLGETGAPGEMDWRIEIRRQFKVADFDAPVGEILDSLSLTVLSMILTDANLSADLGKSLNEHLEMAPPSDSPDLREEVIRIVSIGERQLFNQIRERQIDQISAALGVRVVFEHVCLPPSPIILSDLVFVDYFAQRWHDQDALVSVRRCLDRLRNASVIIVDDAAEFHIPMTQVYGVLSHRLERSPSADLIGTRWQRYADQHQTLPLTVVAGQDIAVAGRDASIDALAKYLDVDVFCIASLAFFKDHTAGWDYRRLSSLTGSPGLMPLTPRELTDVLTPWLAERLPRLKRFPVGASKKLEMGDLHHFCSFLIDKDSVDKVLESFDSFCIAGRPSSVPYIPKRLDQLGKRYSYVASYAPQALANVEAFDCLLICGPMGDYEVSVPAVPIMSATWGYEPRNVDDPSLHGLKFRQVGPSDLTADWYVTTPFGPGANPTQLMQAYFRAMRHQHELAKDVRRVREALAASRRRLVDA